MSRALVHGSLLAVLALTVVRCSSSGARNPISPVKPPQTRGPFEVHQLGDSRFRSYGSVLDLEFAAADSILVTYDDSRRLARFSIPDGRRLGVHQPCENGASASSWVVEGDVLGYRCGKDFQWRSVDVRSFGERAYRFSGNTGYTLGLHGLPSREGPELFGGWGSLHREADPENSHIVILKHRRQGQELWSKKMPWSAVFAVAESRREVACYNRGELTVFELDTGRLRARTRFDVSSDDAGARHHGQLVATRSGWWVKPDSGRTLRLDSQLHIVGSLVTQGWLRASSSGAWVATYRNARVDVFSESGEPAIRRTGLAESASALDSDGELTIAVNRLGEAVWSNQESSYRRDVADELVAVGLAPAGEYAVLVGEDVYRLNLAHGDVVRIAGADGSTVGSTQVHFRGGQAVVFRSSEQAQIDVIDIRGANRTHRLRWDGWWQSFAMAPDGYAVHVRPDATVRVLHLDDIEADQWPARREIGDSTFRIAGGGYSGAFLGDEFWAASGDETLKFSLETGALLGRVSGCSVRATREADAIVVARCGSGIRVFRAHEHEWDKRGLLLDVEYPRRIRFDENGILEVYADLGVHRFKVGSDASVERLSVSPPDWGTLRLRSASGELLVSERDVKLVSPEGVELMSLGARAPGLVVSDDRQRFMVLGGTRLRLFRHDGTELFAPASLVDSFAQIAFADDWTVVADESGTLLWWRRGQTPRLVRGPAGRGTLHASSRIATRTSGSQLLVVGLEGGEIDRRSLPPRVEEVWADATLSALGGGRHLRFYPAPDASPVDLGYFTDAIRGPGGEIIAAKPSGMVYRFDLKQAVKSVGPIE